MTKIDSSTAEGGKEFEEVHPFERTAGSHLCAECTWPRNEHEYGDDLLENYAFAHQYGDEQDKANAAEAIHRASQELVREARIKELQDALVLWTSGETKQHMVDRIAELKGDEAK